MGAPATVSADALAREEALIVLRSAAVEQLESLQLMLDSAVLAAEQVQDKRLELLEEGPEVTAQDVFLEFVLVLGLEAKVVGRIAAALSKRALARRVRQQQALQRLIAVQRQGARPPWPWERVHVGGAAAAGPTRVLTAADAQILRGSGTTVAALVANTVVTDHEVRSMNRWVRALRVLSGEAETGVQALIKAAKAAAGNAARAEEPLKVVRPGAHDTAGVSVLDQVQQYVSSHRMAVHAECAYLEMLVRADVISPQALLAMSFLEPESLMVDGRAVSHTAAKDLWKRYFEAVIWTLLLKERPLRGLASRPWIRRFLQIEDHVPQRLLHYMLRRFINPETDRPFIDTPPLVNPARSGRTFDQAKGALSRFMIDLAKRAEAEGVRLIAAGGTLRPGADT